MKLEPCPFCGGEAYHETDESIPEGYGNHYISCENCAVAMHGNSKENASEEWNQRHTGWVSVDERLPDFEQVVDVWAIWQGRDKLEHGQRMTDVEYFPEMAFPWNHENLSGFDRVTHWMEKPQPPKAKEDK